METSHDLIRAFGHTDEYMGIGVAHLVLLFDENGQTFGLHALAGSNLSAEGTRRWTGVLRGLGDDYWRGGPVEYAFVVELGTSWPDQREVTAFFRPWPVCQPGPSFRLKGTRRSTELQYWIDCILDFLTPTTGHNCKSPFPEVQEDFLEVLPCPRPRPLGHLPIDASDLGLLLIEGRRLMKHAAVFDTRQ